MGDSISDESFKPRLEPRLARIYYHELNVFNNQGEPGVYQINQPAQQELVQDNTVETNMYNSNSLIDRIDREEFINYITNILTTNSYRVIRKLDKTQRAAKPYNELITKDDSDKIIEEVKRINGIAKQKQDLADSGSSVDDDDTAADNSANIGGTKHNKSRRRHKKSKYNKTTRGRYKSRRRRRHKKSTRRRRHKH